MTPTESLSIARFIAENNNYVFNGWEIENVNLADNDYNMPLEITIKGGHKAYFGTLKDITYLFEQITNTKSNEKGLRYNVVNNCDYITNLMKFIFEYKMFDGGSVWKNPFECFKHTMIETEIAHNIDLYCGVNSNKDKNDIALNVYAKLGHFAMMQFNDFSVDFDALKSELDEYGILFQMVFDAIVENLKYEKNCDINEYLAKLLIETEVINEIVVNNDVFYFIH